MNKKVLAILLVIITLVSVFAIPVAAEPQGYPMSCTIYYKSEDGATVAPTKSFSVNASSSSASSVSYPSPTVAGYSLKNSSDAVVTYGMMNKSFPASHYVRHGSATYTVYYVKNVSSTIYYVYGSSMRTAAPAKTVTGKSGNSYTVRSPIITGYTAAPEFVRGGYGGGNKTVYYYESTYTVSFNANGGSGAPSAVTKRHFSTLTLPTTKPTRSGYTFMGWATDSSAYSVAYLAGGMYTENVATTLYAVWSPNTYTVSYNSNGGTGAPPSQTKVYGTALILSSTIPSRSGYSFKGWGTSSSATTASYMPGETYSINANRTLYAIWESNAPTTYTVSYNANGGSGAPSSQTKTHGVTLTLSSTKPTRSGYTFLGWSTSSSAKTASYSAGDLYYANSSCTMYAVWSCSHSSVSLQYITGCKWERVCNNCGVVVSSGTTHGPYNYGDWVYYSTSQHRRAIDCYHGDYSSYDYSSHSTTIEYEIYSNTRHKYYSYCTTCASMIGSANYEAHRFTNTISGGKTISVCNDCGYTKETAQTYTVSYNANGGSGAPASQTKTYGVTLTLSSVVPTRSGYEFMGWGTASSSTTAAYFAGGSYTSNASATLYAIWNCSHSSATKNYLTGCDWQSVCNTCGTILSTGTTHGPYNFSAWEYYSIDQHMRYKHCDYGDFSEAQYQGHSLETKFEQYTASLHKYYSYCSECDSMVGNANTEAHSFITTEGNGNIVYTCSECGYSYSVKKTYSVTYNANGGINPPSNQTKTHGETLTLTTDIPSKAGYDFIGWSSSSTATSASYLAGGSYTSNANITLYAVWQKTIFTVSYNANGGSGAPASQTKTAGETVTISTFKPTRANYAFLGWATTSTASYPEYYGGETYYTDASVVLYAVWQEKNYDFSASELTVSPAEVYQHQTVTIKFRLDSWDKNIAYTDIPVDVLLNGSTIYSTSVDFVAYGVQNIVFSLDVGALEGIQTITARVNWQDHANETRTGNNEVSATFNVKKYMETSVTTVGTGGEYIEGHEVISSFYVTNDGSSDIIPDDRMTFDFEVYSVNGTSNITLLTRTRDDVVIPANATNLIFFKWKIPEGSAGTTFYCRGKINTANASEEANSDNNATEYAITVQRATTSQTPNTRFEETAPAGYTPSASVPTEKVGSASWNVWEYIGGRFEIKTYGITVTNQAPEITPSSSCKTATKNGAVWRMGSGYGLTLRWQATMLSKSGCLMPSSDAYTMPQTLYATFPEYAFTTISDQYRTLDYADGAYCFETNSNADKNERVHFVPVYVQNGAYTISVTATHIWTPAGMITATRSGNAIAISGTVYDDYYVGG